MFIKSFDKRFRELINSMIKHAFEYVNFDKENVDTVYIYCSHEENVYSTGFFFKIKGQLRERHKVNIDGLNYHISDRLQEQIMIAIRKDCERLVNLFVQFRRKVPTQLKIEFYPKTGKFNIKLDYELHWSNTDELLPEDIEDKWFEELKNNNA